MKMPVLFVGHGNPMYTLSENEFTKAWKDLSKTLPVPNAILCISAHWETNGTYVTAMESPETIHDFGGFPNELYEVEYPAPGSPELANKIQKLIANTEVIADDSWGLDHGCWSVLRHLFPDANIPVVELSIDYRKSFNQHYELAQELSELRREGILIIGSGNIVHNLRLIDWHEENAPHDWAVRFNDNVKNHIIENDFASLLKIKTVDKDFNLAVPTPEHFIPLLYALALKEPTDRISIFNDKIAMGSLSMTSIILES